MIVSTPESSLHLYNELARRCAELGLPLWHCDTGGRVAAEPDQPESVLPWLNSPETRAAIERGTVEIASSDTASPRQIAPGQWLVPVEDRPNRVRRAALNVALVLTQDDVLAPRELPRRHADEIPRVATLLRILQSDVSQSLHDSRTTEQLTEKLSQAYEETSVLYRMAKLLNSTQDARESVASISAQLQEILPFGWLAIRFAEQDENLRDLAGQTMLAGRPPCEPERLKKLTDALLVPRSPKGWKRLLDPRSDAFAAATGAEVLAEPITHDDQVIGVLLAGNRARGSDGETEMSSFEMQFLDATADFLSVFHENLSRFSEQQQLFMGTLRALTAAIDAKDRYTRGHSERVALMASKLAESLGWDKSLVEQTRISGLVHDVGKIGIPEAILCKPGRLTDAEFAIIKQHPRIGHTILKDIKALVPMLDGVLRHHERWDGRGYPDGVAGERISPMARVIALADTFDAMSSNRSYRPAMPRERVLDEIRRNAGSQFDPRFAERFVQLDFTPFDDALESYKAVDALEQQAA